MPKEVKVNEYGNSVLVSKKLQSMAFNGLNPTATSLIAEAWQKQVEFQLNPQSLLNYKKDTVVQTEEEILDAEEGLWSS